MNPSPATSVLLVSEINVNECPCISHATKVRVSVRITMRISEMRPAATALNFGVGKEHVCREGASFARASNRRHDECSPPGGAPDFRPTVSVHRLKKKLVELSTRIVLHIGATSIQAIG